jgi:membrane protease YdiL (CAAX protease family)
VNDPFEQPPFEQPAMRTWPHGRELADDECIELSCVGCRTHWRIHDRLRGFKLRCSCDQWLQIPGNVVAEAEANPAITAMGPSDLPVSFSAKHARHNERGLMELPGDDGDIIYAKIPINAPLAPGAMTRASHSNQTRWTNRTLIEFTLLMLALLGPQLVALVIAGANDFELLLPFASLVSGVCVAGVLAWAGPFGRLGIRGAAPRYWLEVLPVVALSVLIAMGYVEVLRSLVPDMGDGLGDLVERLGLLASLLVIAVSPALLEEVIFRGMLQGRLMALMGRHLGIFVTAVTFALVHGQPAVLPIHLGIGIYLGYLRERANSLLPGMLIHFLYNGTLVMMPFLFGE